MGGAGGGRKGGAGGFALCPFPKGKRGLGKSALSLKTNELT